MAEADQILWSADRAFNARDVETVTALMDPDVDRPSAWEGGQVVGRAAVRDYWNGLRRTGPWSSVNGRPV